MSLRLTLCLLLLPLSSSFLLPPPSPLPSSLRSTDVPTGMDVPTKMPSAVGFDYVPLATSLAAGDFKEADQITRDAIIVLAGEQWGGQFGLSFSPKAV